ncbi:sec-independent protein translocase protein TatA [Leucobacter exalbidus]|uniref:Sec-independent protein translocase protein TatA n=1 Tax=Leucobacter exalbidus TaxID=662960 RepID=A0A940PQ02_9MICO|nr:twin-arginine translocase TatA/TatE family subunit [Leucobacter exalbidus]MBP1327040.1 sec-independent protein translocase protein TatA [Leucobacter exalbidus]
MFGNLSGPTLLVILFIVLLLFGAPKLPALAKSLGQSMKILKKEVRNDADPDQESAAASTPPPATPAAPAAPAAPATPAAPAASPAPAADDLGTPGVDKP